MIALLTAAGVAMLFTLFVTPIFVRLFKRIGWGQYIRADGPQSHMSKRGTPTMGGVVFIIGALVGYLVGHLVSRDPMSLSAALVMLLMVGLGAVGFVDDFKKIRNQRSLGLGGWAKIVGQVTVGTVFAVLAVNFPNRHGLTPASLSISFIRDVSWLNLAVFGLVGAVVVFVIWTNAIVTSASNGVNVADGLDGLATGSSIFAIGAYIIICFWQFNQSCWGNRLSEETAGKCYEIRDPLDLAVIAAAITGSLIGFLWWNTSPAQIFMGDVGSLGLGGALAGLAILSRTELLLVFTGGLFVIVTGSVIVQRAYFKATRGRRIFLMSPLQHHFELKGWAEVTIVVRFWIIEALFVGAGVGLFYLEWVSR